MALIKRNELSALLQKKGEEPYRIVLFFGERYLCRESADLLQQHLLKTHSPAGSVTSIDGDHEDAGKTLGQLMTFSLLPGLQIYRVTDSGLFPSTNAASAELEVDELLATAAPATGKPAKAGDMASRYVEAFTRGVPADNVLILTAEKVDKRKQPFKYIKDSGLVVDCSTDTGASTAAQKEQKEVVRGLVDKSLAGFKKKMQPRALEILFERVGFYPMATVMETEKLALSVDDRDLITVEDVNAMVGRTREDALFELTDAFAKKQGARTLVLLNRLLDNGMHSLAILATMRNYLRKLLVFRSLQLQDIPVWHTSMNAGQFQKEYLPALKKSEVGEEWKDLLKGHPYALFMSFSKAQEFSCQVLKRFLELLLQAEFRLKGSPLPAGVVLEELFMSLLMEKRQGTK